jgi:hypothetical protein
MAPCNNKDAGGMSGANLQVSVFAWFPVPGALTINVSHAIPQQADRTLNLLFNRFWSSSPGQETKQS